MTERRDLSSSADASPPVPGPGPGRPLPVALREISRRRVLGALAAVLVVVLLAWTAWGLSVRAAGWLRSQPEFAVPFEAIELVPAPPAALRDGAGGILARVRERAKIDGPIRLLDQDLRELGLSFAKHSPWIAKVERVERLYPRRVVVRVVYREPVARVDLDATRFLVVGDDGVVIPDEEVRPSVAANLLRLKDIAVPPEDLPGHYLGADRDGNVPPEITSAVRLARFLHEADGVTGSPRIVSVNLKRGPGHLLAKTRRNLWVHWRNAPGEEAEDEPKAAQKLERLIRWEEEHQDTPLKPGDFLDFTADSIRLKP